MFYEGLTVLVIMVVLAVLSLFRILPRDLKSFWIFFPVLLLTAVFLFLCRLSQPFAASYRLYFQLLIFGAALCFFILNWRLPGMILTILGVLANGLVICLNGGFMPVLADESLSNKLLNGDFIHHALATSQTQLSILSDQIQIPGLDSVIFSAGDALILLGLIWLVLSLIFGNRQTVSKIENVRHWKI